MAKEILCRHDGLKCDLDKKSKKCRFIDGTWQGQCFDRVEVKK